MLLVGSYLNVMLYTLELVAAYLYFTSQRKRRDPPLIIFAVCFTLSVDTLASFAVCADVFSVRVYSQNFLRYNISSRFSYVSYFGVGQISQLHLQALLILFLREYNESFPSSLVPYCLDHLKWSGSIRCSRVYGLPLLEAVSHLDPHLEKENH